MSEIVMFGNQGKIDPRVWSTFGLSVKESDSPIGQFGTGLKYAIAVLLRNGRSISIKAGDKMYAFAVEASDIRGQEFMQITCNGQPMPFTTNLGKNWSLQDCYREIASNCMDESGIIGLEMETTIYAELGDIKHSEVFLDTDGRRLLAKNSLCEIYAGESPSVYYRGIKAYALPGRGARYTINLFDAGITEDRTLKYFAYDVARAVTNAVMGSNDRSFIVDFLTQTKEFIESGLTVIDSSFLPSDECLDVFRQYRKEDVWTHPAIMRRCMEQCGKSAIKTRPASRIEGMAISKASDFCERIGARISYPVAVSDDLGKNVLGMADRDKSQIYLSGRVLTMGVKQIASTLIEENIHISEGLDDCTYEMQTYLFDQIITMGERLLDEVL